MRRIIGCLFVLGAIAEVFFFASWGAVHGAGHESPWWAFKSLGANYPNDVGYLALAVWLLGLGLYFILTDFAPPQSMGSKPAARPEPRGGPVSKLFLINALLLVTSILCAFVGAKAGDTGPFVSIFAAVAVVQVAVGLLLLLVALFEKPKTLPAMIVGLLVYLAGSAGAVVVFLFGQPT